MISEIQLSTSSSQGTPKDKTSQTESGFQDILSALTGSRQAGNSFASSWAKISGSVINSTLQHTALNNNAVNQNAPRETNPQQSRNINSNSNKNNDPLVQTQSATSNHPSVKNNSPANGNPSSGSPDQTSGNAQSSQVDQNQSAVQNSQTQNPPDQNTQTDKPQNDSLGNNKDVVQKLKDLGLNDQQVKDAVALLDKEAQAGSDKLLKLLTGMQNPGNSNVIQDPSQNIAARSQFLSLLNGQESTIQDLLMKAGVSKDDAKNILDKIEDHQKNSIHVLETLTNNPLGAGIVAPPPMDTPVATDNPADKPQNKNDSISILGDAAGNTNQNPSTQSDKNSLVSDSKVTADILARLQADKPSQTVNTKAAGDAIQIDKNNQGFFSKITEEIQARFKPDKADPSSDPKAKNIDPLTITGNSSSNGGSPTEQAFSIVSTQQSSTQNMGSNNKDNTQTLSLQAISDSAAKSTETVKVTSFTATLEGSTPPIQDTSLNTPNDVKSVQTQDTSSKTTTESSIVNQIIEKFSIRGTGQQSEINIRLDPPDLGTVRVNITSTGDTVKTTLITETHAVKQAIESNLNHLRDAMSDQGLKVDSFTVLVGGGNMGQKGQNTQQQQGGNGPFGAQFSNNTSNPEQTATPLAAQRRAIYDESQSISLFA